MLLRRKKLALTLLLALLVQPYLAGAAPQAKLSLAATYRPASPIESVSLSPNGTLLAVAERNGAVEVLNSSMKSLWSIKLPAPNYVRVKFLNDSLLAILWTRDTTTLTLINLEENFRSDVRLLSNPGQPMSALNFRGRLLILFEKALILVDAKTGTTPRLGDVPFAIANRAVSLFPLNGSRVGLLAVMTHCPLCLSKREKQLIVFNENLKIEAKATICHVLAAYPRSRGTQILVIRDDGYADIYTLSLNKTSTYPLRLFDPEKETFVPGRDVMLVYSFKYGQGLYLRVARPDRLVWKKKLVVLTGFKPVGKPIASVAANGFSTVLVRTPAGDRLVVFDPTTGETGVSEVPQDIGFGGAAPRKVVLYNSYGALVYSLSTPRSLYNVVVKVLGERNLKVEEASISIGGNETRCPQGVCTLKLPRGTYTARVEAPGFVGKDLTLNVSADTVVEVVLYRRLYSVAVTAVDEKGRLLPANITVYDSKGQVVYRGSSGDVARLPSGTYRVEASYEGALNSTLIKVDGDTEVTLTLHTGRYLLVVTAPPGVTPRITVVDKASGAAVFNGTTRRAELELRGGVYLVEATAPGYTAFRREVVLTGDTEINVSMEKLESRELRIVVYGLRGCPHCREANASLTRIYGHVDFREISAEKKYASQYEELYEKLGAGKKLLVPLILVFRGDKLVLAAVGWNGEEWWRSLLSKITPGQVLVYDDEGRIHYVEVDQALIREIVFGKAGQEAGAKPQRHSGLLPLVLALAAADSVNPCTFLVFTALLILTMRASGRSRMIAAAAAFIAAVYTVYLLLGLGLLKVFTSLPWLKYALALLAFAFGAQSLWSVRGGEFHSPVPEKWKGKIENYLTEIAHRGSPLLAFTLGAVISLTLLPCSSGPYLVAMYALAKLPFTEALLYLALYNAIFVAPLLAILVAVALASRKIRALMKTRTRLPKYFEALAGLLLIAIGVYVLLYM